jgi:hypothetical protein
MTKSWRGVSKFEWQKLRERNEALDCGPCCRRLPAPTAGPSAVAHLLDGNP